MNDEILEQHLRDLPAPELPATWRAEIISHALRDVSTISASRSVWPSLLLYLRSMVLRNPITSGAMAALWLLILSFKISTPVDPASARMLLVHIDPSHPVHIVSIQDQIRLVLLAQDQPEQGKSHEENPHPHFPSFPSCTWECKCSRNFVASAWGKPSFADKCVPKCNLGTRGAEAFPMKRFFAKIGRFFWSWGFLKFVLWTITLVIFLYVEEDWRGARAWAATKAEWEAKGESFDFNKFIPPAIPDDQNLAAIPLFKQEPYSKTESYFYPGSLQRAMRSQISDSAPPGNDLPASGNWMRGELPDMAKIRDGLATDYAAAFKGAKLPDDALVQFDALYPFLADLRAAAATRPLCRFASDYTTTPPANRGLVLLTLQIRLSKILTLHAVLALDHHQPDLALEDIKINYLLLSGAKRDPTLVGGLVAIGMVAINNGALYDGLALHAWNDQQLAEIESTLKPVDFLADYQLDFRCEAAESTTNIDYYKNTSLHEFYRAYGMGMSDSDMLGLAKFIPPWPTGWWDHNKSQLAAFFFRELTTVDPPSHRVFPKVALDVRHQVERVQTKWGGLAPWNIWFIIAAPPFVTCTQKYAISEVRIDEARIVCALERYRLAHNAYPDSLDALAPAYIDAVPHDVINGEPYHYQLRPDGTFLLYSVGWNEKDDGGRIVFQKDDPKKIDYNEGDWAWPTPQIAAAK